MTEVVIKVEVLYIVLIIMAEVVFIIMTEVVIKVEVLFMNMKEVIFIIMAEVVIIILTKVVLKVSNPHIGCLIELKTYKQIVKIPVFLYTN
jgi:hypothetical protein